jgi:hypothetical protein
MRSKYLQYFLLLVFALATLFYYRSVAGCLEDLTIKIRTVNLKMVIHNLGTPGSGLEALPRRARTAIGLMGRFDVREYETSETLKKEAELFQRIVEGSWPRKYHAGAKYLLLLEKDRIPESCKLLQTEDGVTLAFCH